MTEYFTSALDYIVSLLRPTFLRPGWNYSRVDLRGDLVAGATVTLIQIPQSMAFALIAGLPAV
jgi:MFS superfamily sulfate permease-like transporter